MPTPSRRSEITRSSPAASQVPQVTAARARVSRSSSATEPAATVAGLTDAHASRIAAISASLAAPATSQSPTPGRLVISTGDPALRRAAAEELARRLNRPLERVDLAELVSRYIGEIEKALAEAFAAAESRDAVLFFDEADALFGRRTDVQDAHDRYANLEVAFHAQAEAHPGIVILGSRADSALPSSPDSSLSLVEWSTVPSLVTPASLPWRRDLRLVRHLLLAAERSRPLAIPPTVSAAYPRAMIDAHLVLLIEAGLLHGTVYRSGDGLLQATAERLTWSGHDAVAALANDASWAEAEAGLLDGWGRAAFTPLLEQLRRRIMDTGGEDGA